MQFLRLRVTMSEENNNNNNSMEKQSGSRHSTMLETNLFAYMMEQSKQCERCVWKNDDYNRFFVFHFIYIYACVYLLSPIVTFKDSFEYI